MDELLTKWEPIAGIDFAFVSAEVHINYPTVSVRLIDGRVNVATHRDLILRFDRATAFTLHEEFVHPEQGTVWGREPTISNTKDTFPCLKVTGSAWFESIKDELNIHYSGSVHYRLCTSFPVVDVVSPETPKVRWYERSLSAQDADLPTWAIEPDALNRALQRTAFGRR